MVPGARKNQEGSSLLTVQEASGPICYAYTRSVSPLSIYGVPVWGTRCCLLGKENKEKCLQGHPACKDGVGGGGDLECSEVENGSIVSTARPGRNADANLKCRGLCSSPKQHRRKERKRKHRDCSRNASRMVYSSTVRAGKTWGRGLINCQVTAQPARLAQHSSWELAERKPQPRHLHAEQPGTRGITT